MHRILLLALLVLPCASLSQEDAVLTKARGLAQSYLIVDGHVDIPYRLREKWDDISKRTADGDYDYVRGKEGGMNAPFMSIYIPSSYENNGAKELADTLIDLVDGLVRSHPDKFAHAYSTADVRANFAKGLVSLPMGMENASPINHDIKNVAYFAKRGIRYITLAHAESNHISNAAYDTSRPWKMGLSPFGEKVVGEMNKHGVMVDISHLPDDASLRCIELSKSPVIASHSCCRAFTPGFERNMSDEVIRALKKNGGIIMIAYASGFLRPEYQKAENEARSEIGKLLRAKGLRFNDPAARAIIDDYQKNHPMPVVSVKDVVDHIDHVVKLAGVDHVGFGSDFDGVGPTLPVGLRSVADLPNLIAELLRRGYSDGDIKKICGENVMRVWGENEKIAEGLRK